MTARAATPFYKAVSGNNATASLAVGTAGGTGAGTAAAPMPMMSAVALGEGSTLAYSTTDTKQQLLFPIAASGITNASAATATAAATAATAAKSGIPRFKVVLVRFWLLLHKFLISTAMSMFSFAVGRRRCGKNDICQAPQYGRV